MKIPFNDLTLPTSQIRHAYLVRVAEILDKGHFVLSEEVGQFEKEWAAYVGTKYAVGVSNGGDALYLSLVAVGVGPGDEVITQGNAYNASVTAILRVGAVPRYADIDPETLQMDVSKIENLINSKTKAIMPVHLYGLMNDMDAICSISEKHSLAVVEDCAQAHGAKWAGKKAGSFGLVNAFSFYPTKNLGAFGDAGAVTTNSEEIREKLIKLRNLGQARKNDHELLGFNMRLDPLQAVALSLKLPHLDELNSMRQELAKTYNGLLYGSNLKFQAVPKQAEHVYHLYCVLSENRQELMAELKDKGVDTGIYYPVVVYRQPFYNLPVTDACPIAEAIANKSFALPLYPGLTKEHAEYVVTSIKNAK